MTSIHTGMTLCHYVTYMSYHVSCLHHKTSVCIDWKQVAVSISTDLLELTVAPGWLIMYQVEVI